MCLAFLFSISGWFLLRLRRGPTKWLTTSTTTVVGALFELMVEALRLARVRVRLWGEEWRCVG